MKAALVMIGGASGALLRYFVCHWSDKMCGSLPIGTLIVNFIGCFLIGLIFGFAEIKGITPEFKLFFVTGFLGAFTTFSAYALETYNHAGNSGINLAMANIALNNIGGLALVRAGLALARTI